MVTLRAGVAWADIGALYVWCALQPARAASAPRHLHAARPQDKELVQKGSCRRPVCRPLVVRAAA